MAEIIIVQDRRDGSFHLVNGDTEELVPNCVYSTLAEARQGAEDLHHRIPQSYIDKALLSDDEDTKALGRLLASEAWPAFERWLDAERTDTAEQTTAVLNAVVNYFGLVLSGVAREHWPIDKPEVRTAIQRLVLRRVKLMLEPR